MLLVIFFAPIAAASVNYEAVLEGLWKETDSNSDNQLSYTEFKVAAEKLDIDDSFFDKHGHDKSMQNFYNGVDENSDGQLTLSEMANSVNKFPDYKDALIAKFTNGAGAAVNPAEVLEIPDAVKSSDGKVEIEMIFNGPPNEWYPGDRLKLKTYWATKANVLLTAVSLLFEKDSSTRRSRSLASTDKTKVTAKIFVPDAAAADALVAGVPTTASAFANEPGFPKASSVAAAPTIVKVVTPPLPLTGIIVIGAVLIVLGLGLCFCASKWSKKRARRNGASGGCCSAGCCSFYAVKPWAFGEVIAALTLVGCVVFLFINMNALTATIVGLVETLEKLMTSNVAFIQDLVRQLPTDITNQVINNKARLNLLPAGVGAPGWLAGVFALLAAVTTQCKGHRGSYCCSKVWMILTFVFLALSFIFYIIFAAFAIVIRLAPPIVQAQIDQITGLCETVPMTVKQLVSDNQLAVDQLKAAGQNVSSFETTLADMTFLATTVDEGCGFLISFIDELIALFLPGLMCIVAIVFAWFVNTTYCCAAGCCRGPPTSANAAVDNKSLQNV